MLISDEYLAEQKYLHTEGFKAHKYGSGGPQWAQTIERIAEQRGCQSILDYGCGKGKLSLICQKYIIHCYDPAVPGFDYPPEPADLVTCLDVMEHVEPQFLDEVIAHIKLLAMKYIFFSISTKPAGRTLRDGRNAHINVQTSVWWRNKLTDKEFGVVSVYPTPKKEWVALLERNLVYDCKV